MKSIKTFLDIPFSPYNTQIKINLPRVWCQLKRRRENRNKRRKKGGGTLDIKELKGMLCKTEIAMNYSRKDPKNVKRQDMPLSPILAFNSYSKGGET